MTRPLFLLPLAIFVAAPVTAQTPAQTSAPTRAQARSHPVTEQTASGDFDVQLTPADPAATHPAIGEMTLTKTFRGGLQATGNGRMLAVRTPVEGSAGYVAMETVTGTLDGRSGSFVLQHSGTMAAGTQSLSVTVVPDSATSDLKGLAGTMTIRIEGGKHFYTFRYTQPH